MDTPDYLERRSYIQCDQVWRNLATLANSLSLWLFKMRVYLVQNVDSTLAILYGIGQIFTAVTAKCWPNYLAIWSHWLHCP